MLVPYNNIPTFNTTTKEWSVTDFPSQEEFGIFLDSLWSDDCDYKFDEDTYYFNELARLFDKRKEEFGVGFYTDHPVGSTERKEFWRKEGKKCTRGVIIIGKKQTWYLTRDYYFLLNYCPFSSKEKGDQDTFADIRDIQYHLALYEKRAEVHHKHGILTKKRQMLSTIYHCAKIINKYWFDRNAINKLFAFDEKYLNIKDGLWKFLIKYKDHLNGYTDWVRHNLPDAEMSWMQRREVTTKDKQKFYKGRMSVISGITLQYSPTKSVGGSCSIAYHEEAGIAPQLDKTYGYIKPALSSGIFTTGVFIAAGSVGDLKQCRPLKRYMYSPTSNGFLSVKNSWVNKNRTPTETGLYIPEHWGLPGFIDEFGNSQIDEAYTYLVVKYKEMESNPEISSEDYQLELSQHPIFLEDAFAHREVSEFPVILLQNQQTRIEIKNRENKWVIPPQKGLLYEDINGKVLLKTDELGPEHEYPIKPTWKDKRGVVTIFEPPPDNPKKYTYFAGVDTVEAEETNTSESLFSIHIFKGVTRITYQEDNQLKTKIEGDKIVATYIGRFSSKDGGVEATNEQGWLLIKKYNAFAFVERSKPNFINFMMRNGRAEQYLAKESDVPVFKDINLLSNKSSSSFGFIITKDNEMRKNLKSFIKEYLSADYGAEYKKGTQEVVKRYRGADRIDDYWLLEELKQYNNDDNFDRFISFGAALIIAKIYQQNGFISNETEIKKTETQDKHKIKKPKSLLNGSYTKSYNTLNKQKKPKSLI